MSPCTKPPLTVARATEGGRRSGDLGQATAEAAVVMIAWLTMLLLLIQPAIWLYVKVVMNSASAAACRSYATSSSGSGESDAEVASWANVRYINTAIPDSSFFGRGASSNITFEEIGGAGVGYVQVVMKAELEPLPLVGWLFGASTGTLGENDRLVLRATAKAPKNSIYIPEQSVTDEPTYGAYGAIMDPNK